ncbi:MAG TPA: DNA-binding protein [Desulfotomaculum sp.]|nr:DNA-binding protein [Desulfotomaculum sp.]HCJ79734.1 DNA-binding protein [Desulfotomaculum sp.]
MKEETFLLVDYRFERAKESLEEAKILLEKGHANTFINRLYYACFYAVSALLLAKGLSSAKHSGIRSLFHRNFIKPGIIDIELGQLYDRLYDSRQKADYADLVRFDLNEVSFWLEETEKFVEVIEILIR